MWAKGWSYCQYHNQVVTKEVFHASRIAHWFVTRLFCLIFWEKNTQLGDALGSAGWISSYVVVVFPYAAWLCRFSWWFAQRKMRFIGAADIPERSASLRSAPGCCTWTKVCLQDFHVCQNQILNICCADCSDQASKQIESIFWNQSSFWRPPKDDRQAKATGSGHFSRYPLLWSNIRITTWITLGVYAGTSLFLCFSDSPGFWV